MFDHNLFFLRYQIFVKTCGIYLFTTPATNNGCWKVLRNITNCCTHLVDYIASNRTSFIHQLYISNKETTSIRVFSRIPDQTWRHVQGHSRWVITCHHNPRKWLFAFPLMHSSSVGTSLEQKGVLSIKKQHTHNSVHHIVSKAVPWILEAMY